MRAQWILPVLLLGCTGSGAGRGPTSGDRPGASGLGRAAAATEPARSAAKDAAPSSPAPAPGDGTPTTATAGTATGDRPATYRLVYRLSGGFAGFDATLTVDGDGGVTYERRRPGSLRRTGELSPAEREALRDLVHGSGFLDLAAHYPPAGVINDAFEYGLRWEEGGTVKEVTGSDGARLPEAFVRVREAAHAIEQKLMAGPAGGQAPGSGPPPAESR